MIVYFYKKDGSEEVTHRRCRSGYYDVQESAVIVEKDRPDMTVEGSVHYFHASFGLLTEYIVEAVDLKGHIALFKATGNYVPIK